MFPQQLQGRNGSSVFWVGSPLKPEPGGTSEAGGEKKPWAQPNPLVLVLLGERTAALLLNGEINGI